MTNESHTLDIVLTISLKWTANDCANMSLFLK